MSLCSLAKSNSCIAVFSAGDRTEGFGTAAAAVGGRTFGGDKPSDPSTVPNFGLSPYPLHGLASGVTYSDRSKTWRLKAVAKRSFPSHPPGRHLHVEPFLSPSEFISFHSQATKHPTDSSHSRLYMNSSFPKKARQKWLSNCFIGEFEGWFPIQIHCACACTVACFPALPFPKQNSRTACVPAFNLLSGTVTYAS